jgi:uncharacterized protein
MDDVASKVLAAYGEQPHLSWLPDRTILFMRSGSHSYGLATETSDEDFKGVAVPPADYFHGFLHRFEQAELHNPYDAVIYDVRKFIALAADCNPNIVECLWTDPPDLLIEQPAGQLLRSHREKFLSKKARHTFSGYAIAQLKRIKTHRAWLLKPPAEKPSRATYNLPEQNLLDASLRGAVDSLSRDGWSTEALATEFGSLVMSAYERERAYHNALHEYHQYERWKKLRNAKRAALEAKSGYDTKHAMHLVRLLGMCREVLETGQVVVKRTQDGDELRAIRNGEWSYDQLIEWAEREDAAMAEVAEKSSLPHSPDREWLDGLCREIVGRYLRDDTSSGWLAEG